MFIDHLQYPFGRSKFLDSFLPFGFKDQFIGVGVGVCPLGKIVNVAKKSAQLLDDYSARGVDKRPDHCHVKLPVKETEMFSIATGDIAIAIHVGALIEDVFHIF